MFSLQFYTDTFYLYYLISLSLSLNLSACTPSLQSSAQSTQATQSTQAAQSTQAVHPTQEVKSKLKSVTPMRHHTFFTQAMGTRFTITLVSQDQIAAHNMARIVFRELDRIETRVSSWQADSEISALNQAAGAAKVSLSEESYRLLAEAQRISRLSEYAFDVTWASLKGLWDFKNKKIPKHKKIKRALKAVGPQSLTLFPSTHCDTSYLHLDRLNDLSCSETGVAPYAVAPYAVAPYIVNKSSNKLSSKLFKPSSKRSILDLSPHALLHQSNIEFLNPLAKPVIKPLRTTTPLNAHSLNTASTTPLGTSHYFEAQLLHTDSRIDLGGIAKGYAIDAIAHVLKRFKYKHFLINGGGDLYAQGTQADGQAWRVGIQHPRASHLWTSLEIPSGYAVVSSGDYERFFMHDHQRYHHIIDLRTGYPAQSSVAVTVMAPYAVEADAWSTALFILGARKGLPIIDRQDKIAGLVMEAHGQVQASHQFRKYFPHIPNQWKTVQRKTKPTD